MTLEVQKCKEVYTECSSGKERADKDMVSNTWLWAWLKRNKFQFFVLISTKLWLVGTPVAGRGVGIGVSDMVAGPGIYCAVVKGYQAVEWWAVLVSQPVIVL